MNDMFTPLRKFATFSGRASRREYWLFQLFMLLISFAFQILSSVFALLPGDGSVVGSSVIFILSVVVSLVLFLPGLAVSVRRLHDIGYSGKLYFLYLIPVLTLLACIPFFITAADTDSFERFMNTLSGVGLILVILSFISSIGISILFFVFHCIRGTVGDNKYGADPYASETQIPEA